jgi:hypothetical protein
MARNVNKIEAGSYLEKSQEFLDEARDAMLKSRFTAAAFNSIQSIINANDALTIAVSGIRASKDHREAVRTHTETVSTTGDGSGKRILVKALNLRSEIGYSGKSASKAQAGSLLKDAVRFIDWVKIYAE